MPDIYTIGYSNHPFTKFAELIQRQGVNIVCDVRSVPYSRYMEEFCQDRLKKSLEEKKVCYLFLGDELGGRSGNPSCFDNAGVASYERMAEEPCFRDGVRRVLKGIERLYRIALMCSEKDPATCHRGLLVARRLAMEGVSVGHILSDGSVESQTAFESRLVAMAGLNCDLFNEESGPDTVAKAYALQSQKVAYRVKKNPGNFKLETLTLDDEVFLPMTQSFNFGHLSSTTPRERHYCR